MKISHPFTFLLPRIILVSFICSFYYYLYEFYVSHKAFDLKDRRKDVPKTLPTERKANLVYDEIFHLYTLQKKPIIWLFWDNFATMPPYISLSFELMQCHNYPDLNVIILNQTTVKEYVKEFPRAYDYLLKVHQADYIRCRLLREYGGMWIDADTIPFASVRYLFDYLRNYDVFGYWWPEKTNASRILEIIGPVIIGPIRANHPLFMRLELNVDFILKQKLKALISHHLSGTPYPLNWTEIMADQMNHIMPELIQHKLTKYLSVNGRTFYAQLHQLGLLGDLFNPYNALVYESLLKKFNYSLPLAVYHNNQLSNELKTMPLEKFRLMDTIFMRLYNVSKRNCISTSVLPLN